MIDERVMVAVDLTWLHEKIKAFETIGTSYGALGAFRPHVNRHPITHWRQRALKEKIPFLYIFMIGLPYSWYIYG